MALMIDGFAYDHGSDATDPIEREVPCVTCHKPVTLSGSLEFSNDASSWIADETQDIAVVGYDEQHDGFAHRACVCSNCGALPRIPGETTTRCAACFGEEESEPIFNRMSFSGAGDDAVKSVVRAIIDLQTMLKTMRRAPGLSDPYHSWDVDARRAFCDPPCADCVARKREAERTA